MATIRKRGGKFQAIVRRGCHSQAKTFSECNLSEKTKTLRCFCVDARLNYDTVIARLEMVGKEV
jgi:hypothetical protein